MIAAWKLELNGILHIFNVCSFTFTWLSLTAPSQTELVLNAHMTISDIRHDVSKIRERIGDQTESAGTRSVVLITKEPSPVLYVRI